MKESAGREDFLHSVPDAVVITALTQLEVASALARWVRMSEFTRKTP
ncbi:hypothetical protein MYX84_01740 [Acidobacteria bacterium AH-259-O06]|nr:hypothetical protein [Acidobacteria bacterium AH-259-O06]